MLTLYLREPGKPRRRPGSAAAIAELSTRVSRGQLRAERKLQFRSPIAKIRRYAKQSGMRIFDVDPTRRRVRLRATSTQSEKAFATRLRQIEHGACHYRCPGRTPRVPQAIADVVQAVLGFDVTPLNSFTAVQQFINQVLSQNNEQGGVQISPHKAFWSNLTYDQFVNGNVPGVSDPNTGNPVPILVKGDSAQSNFILALRGSGPMFGPEGAFGQMPANGPPFFSEDQISSIAAWIDQGCPQ